MQNKIENLFKYINSIDIKIYSEEIRKIAFEEAKKNLNILLILKLQNSGHSH